MEISPTDEIVALDAESRRLGCEVRKLERDLKRLERKFEKMTAYEEIKRRLRRRLMRRRLRERLLLKERLPQKGGEYDPIPNSSTPPSLEPPPSPVESFPPFGEQGKKGRKLASTDDIEAFFKDLENKEKYPALLRVAEIGYNYVVTNMQGYPDMTKTDGEPVMIDEKYLAPDEKPHVFVQALREWLKVLGHSDEVDVLRDLDDIKKADSQLNAWTFFGSDNFKKKLQAVFGKIMGLNKTYLGLMDVAKCIDQLKNKHARYQEKTCLENVAMRLHEMKFFLWPVQPRYAVKQL